MFGLVWFSVSVVFVLVCLVLFCFCPCGAPCYLLKTFGRKKPREVCDVFGGASFFEAPRVLWISPACFLSGRSGANACRFSRGSRRRSDAKRGEAAGTRSSLCEVEISCVGRGERDRGRQIPRSQYTCEEVGGRLSPPPG